MSLFRRAALAAALAVSVLPASALAITNGSPDGNAHPAVGLLVADGGSTPVCSGTLVAPTVFLTAGHCLAGIDPSTLGVRFDTGLVPAVGGTVDPAFGRNKADLHDLAVVRLAGAPAGIVPARLGPAGALDGVAKGTSLTAVGYGYYDRVTGGGQPRFLYDGVRRSATSPVSTVLGVWVKLSSNVSGGVCFGDSGGPWLLGGSIVAVVSGGSGSCSGNSDAYRVDTPAARAFLAPFVPLA